jgi:uncharacterized protein YjbI with pentapeptide repeats
MKLKLTQQELNEKLKDHKLWLEDETKGNKLDLSYCDCYGLNFHSANMRSADMRSADMSYADMSYADMSYANMSSADMSSANMSYADMSYADMSYANIHNTTGNSKEIKTIQTEKYTINITKNNIQIGCKNHTMDEWINFTDEKIDAMDRGALEWWNKWKDIIKSFIEAS